MSIKIRSLTAEHLADYKLIRLDALATEPSAFVSNYEEESAMGDDAHWLRLQLGAVYGAYQDDKIIGMAGVIYYREQKLKHKAAIWGVYVAPDCRGQGIGRRMMKEVLNNLPDHVSHITLGVEENNKTACKLYETFGFEQYGVERGAFCKDGVLHNEILMVKTR